MGNESKLDGSKPGDVASVKLGYNPATGQISASVEIPDITKKVEKIQRFLDRAWFWPSKVKKRAKQNARNGVPSSDATRPGGFELEIRARRTGWLGSLAQEVANIYNQGRSYIAKYTPRTISTASVESEIEASLSSQLDNIEEQLKQTQNEYNDSRRRLKNFKDKKGLDREPTCSKEPLDAIAILFALAVAEVIFNAALLGNVSQQGFIGGTFFAVGISAINVLLGLIVGVYGWRYAVWGEGKLQYLAIAGTLIGCVLAILVNLFIAQYRELAEKSLARPSDAEFTTLETVSIADVMSHLFVINFTTLESVFLLILGLGISGFAMYEGAWKVVDRVPDFASLWRANRRCELRRNNLYKALRNGLTQQLDEFSKFIVFQQMLHQFFAKEMESVRIKLDAISDEADAIVFQINNWARKHIRDYRDVHAEERVKASRGFAQKKAEGKEPRLPDPGDAPEFFPDAIIFPEDEPFPDNEVAKGAAHDAEDTIEKNIRALDLLRKWVAGRKQKLADEIARRAPEDQYHKLDDDVVLARLRSDFKTPVEAPTVRRQRAVTRHFAETLR